MKPLYLTISTALLALQPLGVSALVSSPELDRLKADWHGWSRKEKALFHVRLVETMAESSKEVRHASARDLASITALNLCNYAGFVSLVENRTCKSPWGLNARNKDDLSLLYVKYQSCGMNNVVRCNPLLYGTRREHSNNNTCLQGRRDGKKIDRGCCVRVEDENDGGGVTQACNTNLFGNSPDAIKNFIRSLSSDPKRLIQYLLTSLAVIKNCNPTQQECAELKQIVQTSLNILGEDDFLQCQLPQALANLGVGMQIFQDFVEDLEYEQLGEAVARAFTWKERRMEILHEIIDRVADDPRTANVIETARLNQTGRQGECYKFVKRALAGIVMRGKDKEGFLGEYYLTSRSQVHAKYAVNHLAERGFINITDLGYPLDPNKAPHGSVVVYRDTRPPTPARPIRSGHVDVVEIKPDGTRRFYSDHVRSTPVSDRAGSYVPIGIMLPVSDHDKKTLGLSI